MSTTIDQRIVEMQFDNRHFERNVETSMSTLDKLKQSLNLSGASKGLEDVGAAARGINMSPLAGAVETVGVKFNALWTIADQTLRNITNSVYNTGQRMISALTIDPVKTGLSEYETQINAVQTILANTESKGTTLGQVNSALDELNTYADKTIYNFTEMTRNIGTFTAAGVDLNTSVNAIQGIANLAAVSGSTSQQASTAMYQLSQALSSGTVKLMDWNSVVNAGMGGQVFQDALKETARVHGVNVDKMIEKHGSFRETLQEGWITSDILTETLSHFTMAAEEGSEEWEKYKKSLMDDGYSEEQAKAILKLSNTATDAATKVKTASQLWDTLKETAQSGWTQTWEIILGDFGEAKELFTEIYETLSPMIDTMSQARNELLSEGLSSGWKQLMSQGIPDEEGYRESVKAIAKDHGVAIDDMIEAEKKLDSSLTDADAFQKALQKGMNDGSITSDMLSESVTHLADKMRNMTDAEREAAGYTDDHILKIEELEEGLKKGTISMDEFVKKMQRPSGRENLIESMWNAFKGLMSVIKPVKDAFNSIFPALTGEQLYGFTETLKEFTSKLTLSDKASLNLKRTFRGLFSILDIVGQAFKAVFKAISPLFGKIDDLGGGILELTAGWGDWFVLLNQSIEKTDFFTKTMDKVVTAVKNTFNKVKGFLTPIIDGVKEFGTSVMNALGDISLKASIRLEPLAAIGEFIKGMFAALGKAIEKVAPFVFSAVKGIGGAISSLMKHISDAVQGLDYNSLFDVTNGGIFAAIGIYIAKMFKSGGGLLDNAGGFLDSIKEIFSGVSETLNTFQESLKADVLKKIAIAIGILAASLLVLSLIDSERLGVALTAITAMFAELIGSLAIFTKLGDMKGVGKIATSLISLSAALLILSIALKIMSTMSWEEMGIGLIAMVVGLAALVGAVNLLPKDTALRAAGMIGLATAMVILGAALKIMGTMSWEEIAKSLVALTGSLLILAVAMNIMMGALPGAAAMLVVAPALVILGAALKIISGLSWEEIAKGLVALAGSLIIIAVAMNLMLAALPGALAMLVIAPALLVLSGALKIMSGFSWEEIAKGLVALAGSLLIIAGAMYLMTGALPGALALVVVSAALMMFAPVLMLLSSMSWEEVARGLVALAGGLAIIGIAGALMAPIIPAILGLAGAVALLGVACLTIGVGVAALGIGLTAISSAGGAATLAMVTFISSLIGLIPYLIEQVGVGIIALCETIAGSAAAICKAVTVIVLAVVEALVAAVPPLVEGLLVLIVSLLDSLVTHLPTIVAKVAVLVVNLLLMLAEHLPAIVGALFVLLVAAIDSIAANITSIITPLVNLVVVIFQGIADAIGPIIQEIIVPILTVFKDIIVEISEAIGAALEGLATAFASVFDGIATVIESVGTSIKSVLDGIAGIIESIGEAALNAGTGFENLANGVKTITDLKLADMAASLAAVATGIGSIAKHASDLEELGTGMKNLGKVIVTSMVEGVADQSSKLTTAAKEAIDKFAEGIEKQQNTANKACKKLVSSCVDTIKDKSSSFKSAGKYLVEGFADGISVNTYMAKAKAKAMAAAAAQAAKEELDEHSPSRVGYEIGDYFGIAFVNSIADNITDAYKTSKDLAASARNGLSDALSRANDFISSDMDSQPTIRPVLDLSDVRSGVGAIGSMFGSSTLGVSANVNTVSSMMSGYGQNRANADVVDAIDKLNKRFDSIGNTTYQINGVTYDDGSNVSSAIQQLVHAARIDRRV